MDKFPGPVHADDETGAETRRADLRDRFRAVSHRLDQPDGTGRDGTKLSMFEIALIVAGGAFVLWTAGRLFGLY